ncbi:hypothetical protein [Cereibacter azotoformans]|nr:hypothetical protein [Cereibacter azotoformans]
MGLVMPVVAYVSGRGADAENPGTAYNIQKRAFLDRARDAIQRFYSHVADMEAASGSPGCVVMRRAYDGPDLVFETDRGTRPGLAGLLRLCTILATQPSDLCRDREDRAIGEVTVFRDLVADMSPVFFVPGFEIEGYGDGFRKKNPDLHATGLSLMEIIWSKKYRKLKEERYFDFVSEVMQYTMDIRWRSQESAKRT